MLSRRVWLINGMLYRFDMRIGFVMVPYTNFVKAIRLEFV
jgi:hypothetical protein